MRSPDDPECFNNYVRKIFKIYLKLPFYCQIISEDVFILIMKTNTISYLIVTEAFPFVYFINFRLKPNTNLNKLVYSVCSMV